MPRPPLPAALMHERLIALLKAMPAASSGDIDSVHRARVASRRLREALPVLADIADRDTLGRVRKQVRRITRALGPVRELDVALGHLDEWAERVPVSARAVAAVRRSITDARRDHRRQMLDTITPIQLEKLKKRLGEAAGERPIAFDREAEAAAASKRAATRAQELQAATDRAGGMYLPDRLHAVRVSAKKLRYALEVERELRRSRATRRIDTLKALQDRLGRMHDLEILIDRIRGVQVGLATSDRATATELDRLLLALEQHCREEHAAYMSQRHAILDLCERIREAAQAGRSTLAA